MNNNHLKPVQFVVIPRTLVNLKIAYASAVYNFVGNTKKQIERNSKISYIQENRSLICKLSHKKASPIQKYSDIFNETSYDLETYYGLVDHEDFD